MSPLTNTPLFPARPLNLGPHTLPKSLYISNFNVSIPNHQIFLPYTYNPPRLYPLIDPICHHTGPFHKVRGSIYSKNTAIKPFKPLTKYTKYSQTLLPSKMCF